MLVNREFYKSNIQQEECVMNEKVEYVVFVKKIVTLRKNNKFFDLKLMVK